MELLDDTLGGMLEKWAAETPDTDFMVYPDRGLRFSYAEFDQRVNQLAKGLLEIGVKKGDKVGIWANNVPDRTNTDVCDRQNRGYSGYHQHQL